MSWFEKSSQGPEDVFDAAAAWVHRTQNDAAIRNAPEFKSWIGVPEHSAAFDAMLSSMNTVTALRGTAEIQEMRRAALARFRHRKVAMVFSWRTGFLAAAAALVFIVAGEALVYTNAQSLSYATEIGERRIVTLSDGSRISLDSDSRVKVRYTEDTRSIVMERGRTRFDVAHDVKRPFMVTADGETVVAVGTSFAVEKLHAKVLVTLIQGRVLVQQADLRVAKGMQPQPTISLSAGEQLMATRDGNPLVSHVDLDMETAWESGHLVFRGLSLRDAAEEVNRYTNHAIMVDPSVSDTKISGIFNAGDVEAFVQAVTAYFPISATTNANGVITLGYRS